MNHPLQGKYAVVAGATVEIGKGAAYALSEAGAHVTLLGPSASKLVVIQQGLPFPDASTIVEADYSTVEGVHDLKEKLTKILNESQKKYLYDVAIVSSGPWWREAVAGSTEVQELADAVSSNLSSHLFLFNTLTKFMQGESDDDAASSSRRGQYLMINGMAAKGLKLPPDMGLRGVLANAADGASQVMHYECETNAENMPAFTQVMISPSVGRSQRLLTHEPIDANSFGRVFVAMALGRHKTDAEGTIVLDDACHENLTNQLVY